MSDLVPMWLLIDDIRELGCPVIARTAEAARTILGGVGYAFECVCFDYDLGVGETGYDILKWAIEAEVLPNHVQLVTRSPVGRKNMAAILESHKYTSTDGFNYFKPNLRVPE